MTRRKLFVFAALATVLAVGVSLLLLLGADLICIAVLNDRPASIGGAIAVPSCRASSPAKCGSRCSAAARCSATAVSWHESIPALLETVS